MKVKASAPPRIALALAGGGPLGAIYEIGALCALQESLKGIDFTELQHHVGVSDGGFIAAGLANGITPHTLCASFIENDDETCETFDPSWLLEPAYGEFVRRGIMLPGLLLSALWHFTAGRKSFIRALERLSPGLPTDIFSNEQIHVEPARLYAREGRSNKTGLSEKLWRHGISLHHVALDDPKRHLSAPVKPASELGRAIAPLQEIMDDLGHVVRSAAHTSSPSW